MLFASKNRFTGGALLVFVLCAAVFSTRLVADSNDRQGTQDARVALGRALFFDPSLSASGKLSCSSCHDPAHAYAPANALATQAGGAHMDQQGARAVPSLRYVLNRTPQWSKVYVSSAAERMLEANESPVGGFGWDGRFNSLHEQAGFPLLAGNEMANASPQAVVRKIAHAPYAAIFRKLYGNNILETPREAYGKALEALEAFELHDPSLHPYSSKFDAWLDGKAMQSAQEARGQKLFDDPERGNCASCHPDKKGADGSHPLLTTYQFEALGVPRNREILANADVRYFDMGLCGPIRQSEAGRREYCGMFKTPTLRNVASRGAFFHNGRFHNLKDALRFYVQRDTHPARWYPPGKSSLIKFDDLPAAMRGNIDTADLPLTKKTGEAPVWNDPEIYDVIAFLKTLDDADVTPPALTGAQTTLRSLLSHD